MKERIDKASIDLTGSPSVLVEVKPEKWAVPHQCHVNVEYKVQHDGGEKVEGWGWQPSKDRRCANAFHHSVWRSPDGSLIDITPDDPADVGRRGLMSDLGNDIYFSPQDFHGRYPCSQWFALTKNKAVKHWVHKARQRQYQEWKKGQKQVAPVSTGVLQYLDRQNADGLKAKARYANKAMGAVEIEVA